ncbi:MAG: type II secretion system protein M [Gammaproteobacteria bacterium]|nr:type II secretion system protein M [Gammaproteobacteria bacterium]MBU1414877.1 type II secretion system protein M [Gammaproteobacteria bacterium]
MNSVKKLVYDFRRLFESPRYPYLPTLLGAAVLACVIALVYWLPAAQLRQSQRELEAAGNLKAIQKDLAEIERLGSRTLPPQITGETLRGTLAASLASHGTSMSVDMVDADHVRLHGTGPFDVVTGWLGGAQQSHRFGIKSMVVKRQGDSAAFDMTLSSGRE